MADFTEEDMRILLDGAPIASDAPPAAAPKRSNGDQPPRTGLRAREQQQQRAGAVSPIKRLAILCSPDAMSEELDSSWNTIWVGALNYFSFFTCGWSLLCLLVSLVGPLFYGRSSEGAERFVGMIFISCISMLGSLGIFFFRGRLSHAMALGDGTLAVCAWMALCIEGTVCCLLLWLAIGCIECARITEMMLLIVVLSIVAVFAYARFTASSRGRRDAAAAAAISSEVDRDDS